MFKALKEWWARLTAKLEKVEENIETKAHQHDEEKKDTYVAPVVPTQAPISTSPIAPVTPVITPIETVKAEEKPAAVVKPATKSAPKRTRKTTQTGQGQTKKTTTTKPRNTTNTKK